MKKLFLVITTITSFLLCSCSSTTSKSPVPEDFSLNSINLLIVRSNLKNTEFEQYNIQGNKLFLECGRYLGGRFSPTEQSLIDISPELLTQIIESSWLVAQTDKVPTLDQPGTNRNLFDPGIFKLSLTSSQKSMEVNTSFDAIATPASKFESKLKKLTLQIRQSSTPPHCGNLDFYQLNES